VETWFLGADTIREVIQRLLPGLEVRRHPRLSALRAIPSLDVVSLPPRSAAVAFSVDDVYALADRLRKGGAAVVLGALSPRTRNAQVAAYQAGELRYMVATDAIGMGLNLDIDHVAFATTHKYDGAGIRDLEAAELGQIAGRAGRYERDGTFGTLLPQRPLPPPLSHAIEEHRFPRVGTLYWRNAALDFSSLPNLLASLEVAAPADCLRVPERTHDLETLRQLARLPEVQAGARGETRLRTLWDLCQIPNYRKEPLDSHVGLVAALWRRLAEGRERVDSDWLARRVDRLDDPHGDLPALVDRIASIRTWTYVSNHETWVESARWWQARTREIEDRLSDALHLQLLARFGTDRRPAPRAARSTDSVTREHAPLGEVTGPFEALAKLRELTVAGHAPRDGGTDAWVDAMIDAPSRDFYMGDDGRLHYQERRLGRLTRGRDLLHPEFALDEGTVRSPGARLRARRRGVAAIRDLVERWLAPLRRITGRGDLRIGAPARGLLYALEADLGVVEAKRARSQLRSLRAGDERLLTRHGIVFTADWIVSAPLVDAEFDPLREALVVAWLADALPAHQPASAAALLAVGGAIGQDAGRWLARVAVEGGWVPVRDQIA
jgi:ATP-dependent RNA helicase SUPV3L1/SUV3